MPRPFLTAEWNNLAMLNYRVDPALLVPLVPAGTTLDLWQGAALVSVVGFQFLRTRVRGVPIPYHRDFAEVNLRFYTRRRVGDEVRRGVTFIRELVPRRAIAQLARWAYNEPYVAVPMRSDVSTSASGAPAAVSYEWRSGPSNWCRLQLEVRGAAAAIQADDCEACFVSEHYWGYTRQRDGSTIEYHVSHPRWRVWADVDAALDGDTTPLYGAAFAAVIRSTPCSAFVADGSAVTVFRPVTIA
ncbi:MAG TPA: DUF2071 domain-containing protein [Vicinamibacterales bacterium]|nr:DUF2071 domain-containing protein [Vicinamibacterales bacterium]